jgi:hypothetical protein
MEMFYFSLSKMAATSQMWVVSTEPVVNEIKELNFKF